MTRYIIKLKEPKYNESLADDKLNTFEHGISKSEQKQRFNKRVKLLQEHHKSNKDKIKNKFKKKTEKCRIKAEYKNIPELLSVEIDDDDLLSELKADPSIEIREDGKCRGAGQYQDWGYVHTKVDTNYRGKYTGSGIKVAIVDGGIHAGHEDLPYPVAWRDFVNGVSTPYDDFGHGTFIAGIIAAQDNDLGYVGVAPDVSLYVCKVTNSSNFGWTSDFISGVDWAISQGVDVINLSLVTEAYEPDLVDATRSARSAGILVVACSGNGAIIIDEETAGWDETGKSTVDCPAVDYSCIAVGSIDSDHQRSGFSNYGDGLDFVAPGDYVVSTDIPKSWGNYSQWYGTSFAAAYVTGHIAALWSKYPDFSASEIENQLIRNAEYIGSSWEYGNGLVMADPEKSFKITAEYADGFQVEFGGLQYPSNQYDYFYARSYINTTYIKSTPQWISTSSERVYSNRITGLNQFTYYKVEGWAVWNGVPNLVGTAYGTTKIDVPAAPTITDGYATSPTEVYLGWTTVSGATKYEIRYLKDGFWETKQVTGTSDYVGGLMPATSYTFYVRAYNGYTWSNVSFGKAITTKDDPRPAYFSWSTNIQAGAPFNVLAYDWNALCKNVNDVRTWDGGRATVVFPTVYKDDDVTASIFNKVRDAIATMYPTTSPPSTKSPLNDVLASDFKLLIDSLNSKG